MDIEEPVLGPRAKRAVPLIAAALTVIVVGGLLYLRSAAPTRPSYTGPARIPQLDPQYWPAFDFVTPSLGWAAIVDMSTGRVWVYRTTDGASHWQRVFAGAQAYPQGPTIHFFDRAHGLLHAGRLYRTSDAGAHWEVISIPDASPDFVFASPTNGWVVDNSVSPAPIYATKDGGSTWHLVGHAPAPFYGATGIRNYTFRANGEGWGGAEVSTPTVWATFDGGATWRAIPLPVPPSPTAPLPEPLGKPYLSGYYTGVQLLPGNGVLADEFDYLGHDFLFVSVDRGATWTSINSPLTPAAGGDFAFIDSQHWWVSRYGLVYTTSDAGRSWKSVRTNFPDGLDGWSLNSAHVIDARHAWLVIASQPPQAGRRALAMSSDGGVHWSMVNLPQPR